MPMMALLPPGGLLGGYAADPGGVNGSWEKASTGVSLPICARVALAIGEHSHHLAPCGNIVVQHYCMPVADNAIVHIAADDNAASTD